MILPGAKGPQAVQVKKVLHDTLALRGRCARVVLVCKPDESDKCNESKLNPTIPAPESMCVPRCSPCLQSCQGSVGKFDLGLPHTLNWCLSFHIQPPTRNLCARRQPVSFLVLFCALMPTSSYLASKLTRRNRLVCFSPFLSFVLTFFS
jgi:hypothetical protein